MPHLAARWAFRLSLLTSSLVACGDSDSDRSVDVEANCDSLEECSIADAACQRAILEITACVRGDVTPPLPPIRVLARADLMRELVAGSEPSEPADAADSERAIERAFAALGLIAERVSLNDAAVAEQTDSVAAFYRTDRRDVTIISDTAMERGAAMNALSHELTHYLQDRSGQLSAARKADVSMDESVARRALAEGEAVVTSFRAYAAMQGEPASSVNWDAIWERIEGSITEATSASSSPLVAATNQLPYLISPPAIQLAWERGGRARVDQLFVSPPLTQLDWLRSDAGLGDTRAETLDCYPSLPPDGYQLVGFDSLGVAGVFALLGSQGAASLGAASRWRQDRMAIYTRDENVLAVWRIRLADERSAMQLASALDGLDAELTRSGAELLIRASAGPASSALLSASECPSRQEFSALAPSAQGMQSSLSRLHSLH
jgi:hypothetical protein